MRSVALYEMLLGLLTAVGGIIGFASADSWISLLTGVPVGAVLAGAGLAMQKGSRKGMFLALAVSVLLAVYGAERYLSDGTFYPGGLVLIFALLSVLFIALVLVQPKERKRIF